MGFNSQETKQFPCYGDGCNKKDYINCKLSDGQELADNILPTSLVKDFAEHPWRAIGEVVAVVGLAVAFVALTLLTGGAAAAALGAAAGAGYNSSSSRTLQCS